MENFRLLALDLDGTLLDGRGTVPPGHAAAVRAAQQKGVQIALCSGRNLCDVHLFSDQLEAPADWAVSANGADVRPMSGGAPIFCGNLTDALCREILEVCADCGGEPCFYTCKTVYYGAAFERFIHAVRASGHGYSLPFEELDNYIRIHSAADWEAMLMREAGQINKAILYHDTPEAVDEIAARLEKTGRYELAPSVMFGGQLKNIEVNRAGTDKARALTALADHLGIPMSAVLAVGDSDNDLGMLRAAGLGVAMSNAPAHVQAAADAVSPRPNTENGLADVIETYILHGGNQTGGL